MWICNIGESKIIDHHRIVKKHFVDPYKEAMARAIEEQNADEHSKTRNSVFDQMSQNLAGNGFQGFDNAISKPASENEFTGYVSDNALFKDGHKHKHQHHKHSHQHENHHQHAHQHLQEHDHSHKHNAKHQHRHKHQHHHEHNHHHKHKEAHDHEEDHDHDHEHSHKHKGGSLGREGHDSVISDRRTEQSSQVKFSSFVPPFKPNVKTHLPIGPSTFTEYQDIDYDIWQLI